MCWHRWEGGIVFIYFELFALEVRTNPVWMTQVLNVVSCTWPCCLSVLCLSYMQPDPRFHPVVIRSLRWAPSLSWPPPAVLQAAGPRLTERCRPPLPAEWLLPQATPLTRRPPTRETRRTTTLRQTMSAVRGWSSTSQGCALRHNLKPSHSSLRLC